MIYVHQYNGKYNYVLASFLCFDPITLFRVGVLLFLVFFICLLFVVLLLWFGDVSVFILLFKNEF